ncbi:MAG: right-handed parallel beta-helix repeat-containing protein [Myxococcales bacterium]|nr:right-handed parallel beta-helix repeat-containing protein [Myxococcales bacterium]
MIALWSASAALAGTLTVSTDGPYITLDAAVSASSPGDVIDIAPGVYPTLGAQVPHALTIRGSGSDQTFLEPVNLFGGAGALQVWFAHDVHVEGITLHNSSFMRALFLQQATVTLEDVVLRPTDDAIDDFTLDLAWVSGSDVTLRSCVFSEGAGVTGGAVFASGSVLTVESSTFEANKASQEGGALYLEGTDATFVNTTFVGNEAVGGGAILAQGNPTHLLRVEDSVFTESTGSGGAILGRTLQLEVTGSTFEGNTGFLGGAIHVVGNSRVDVRGNRFHANTAAAQGGSIYAWHAQSLQAHHNVFVDSGSEAFGGAMLLAGAGVFDIGGNRFCGSEAGWGGALFLQGFGGALQGDVHHNVFVDSITAAEGTAIWQVASEPEVRQNVFLDHPTATAPSLYLDGVEAVVNNVAINPAGLIQRSEEDGDVGAPYNLVVSTLSDASTWFVDDALGCESAFLPVQAGPLVDAGDPAVLDDDGSRSDLGLYGGPGASDLFDLDGDGAIEEDCAPYDPDRVEASEEVVGDGVDQDCDGTDLCYVDGDGDGVGGVDLAPGSCTEAGLAATTGDCDDADPARTDDCFAQTGPAQTSAVLPQGWFCGHTSPRGATLLGLWGLLLLGRRRCVRGASRA